MMHKPDLKVDQLSELYLCVCDGVDYSDLLDKPASDIFVERLKRSEEIWGSKSDKLNEEDVFFNAMNEIAKLKGLC